MRRRPTTPPPVAKTGPTRGGLNRRFAAEAGLRVRRAGVALAFSLGVALAAFPASASAAPVEMRVAPSVIHVGDSVRVEVRVTPAEGVELPPEIKKLGAFDVLSLARADSAGQAVFRYVLTTFELGQQTIPPVAIPVRSGGRVDTLRSNPWRVTVESLLPADSVAADSAQLRPAAAPLALRGAFRWGVFFLYLALLAALILGGRWLWARRPKKALLPAFVPAPVARPPDAVALEALDAVAARAYVERGLFKPHYTEVMDVLRTYVEGRYSLEALDRTTPELLEAMREKSIAPGLRGTLAGLLEEADLVKFARVTPDAASARALLDAARTWVRESTAAAAAAAATSAAAKSAAVPAPVAASVTAAPVAPPAPAVPPAGPATGPTAGGGA